MKSVWNVISVASLVLALTAGMSQSAFAQQVQKTPEEQKKAALDDLSNTITSLLDQTNSAIAADIDATKTKIQKMKDIKAQDSEIRQMLLVVTGRMSTYTSITFNLYVAAIQDEPSAFPFILTATKDTSAPEVTWFEFMKDPANAPAFNNPSKLMDTISMRFAEIAIVAKALIPAMAQNILDKIIELKNAAPDSVAPSQSNPSNPQAIDPNLLKTKFRLRSAHQQLGV